MKVLFLSIVPSPYQRDIFSSLSRIEGLDIDVRYAEAGSPDSPWPKAELESYEAVYKSFYLSWKGKRFIINRQVPSTKGYDAVVLNGYVTVPAQWILRTAKGAVPLIFWGEKLEHAQGGLRERMQRVLTGPMHKLSAIVAIGKKACRDYAVTFPGVPVYEVPYYCSIDAFRKEIPDRPRTPPRILFCGQMIARKGVDLLLEAFVRIITDGIEARLVLIGREGDLPSMMAVVPDAVRAHIDFKGFQAPADLPGHFAEADLFVLPSRYDGWGVVVNQALGAGLPAICSDAVGAAEDLIEEGGNGYVFPNEDVDRLEACLRALLTEPDRMRTFGARSLALSAKLTPDQGAHDLYRILQEVTERR
jgi:poly(glycerol-phosphate) alpha-glucosyltransferase